jgi:hypothetical protein
MHLRREQVFSKSRLKSFIPTFGSLSLSFYVFVGPLLILLTEFFWVKNINLIGEHLLCSFSFEGALLYWLFAIPSFVIILFVTTYIKRKDVSCDLNAIIASTVNGLTVFVMYFIYLAYLPELISAFAISFIVISLGIVGIATYSYLRPTAAQSLKLKYSMTDEKALIEALKLEHSANMGLANNVIWVTIILIVSVVFLSWTQVIYPSLKDPTLVNSFQMGQLQAINIIQLVYLSFGIWFGILSPLWTRAWQIVKDVAKFSLK